MIKVTALHLTGKDDRGENYTLESFRTGEFILCYRKAGSSSGQHYHTGKSAHKDPEILFLLSGKAELHWCTLDNRAHLEVLTIEAPARVEVPKLLWHQLIAVTDCSFLELNSLADVQADSVRIWKTDLLK
ncbi:hypothetical protein GA0116948_104128 [Chitinophaga costaii]|uniref:WxcM-like, C-terminal n=1 Tax=Chitinophaga costaii TaxID=1335309 RepID=A0A1C4CHP3_9BACT|nr:hypothetical protein [Chitinophaga costaii]PUZ27088.1 hypothetical protein DCM91_07640 [Chitinophaga costaii]SCC18574.1 hypothetical protein GA0116948_104128 [Chitinophaga costaii]